MQWNSLTRRHFLSGTGSFCLALPWLESLMPRALAQNAAQQKSLVLFFKPNGCYPDDYFPHNLYAPGSSLPVTTLGGNSEFRECPLESLGPVVSRVLAEDFNDIRSAMNVYWGLGTAYENHNAFIPFATSPNFPSIDQIVAKSIQFNKTGRGVTALRGTTIGYEHDAPASFELINGTVRAVPVIKDALIMFQRLFGQGMPSSVANMPEDSAAREMQFKKLVQEKRVLDQVLEDYKRLRQSTKLSSADKQILDDYVAFIDQKQRDLAQVVSQGSLISPSGPIPAMPSASVNASPLSMTDTMIDLMVAAIKTNTCNVFNFQLAMTVDETKFPFSGSGYTEGSFHSEISHNQSRKADHLIIDKHLFSRVARAYKALNTPMSSESGITYADNSCLYISGDMGAGEITSNHTSYNAIAVSLSGKNIPIKTGRALAYSSSPKGKGYPSNQLLMGLMEAVGAKDWREVLAKNGNKAGTVGFGEYGGTQRALSDEEKMRPLPYLLSV